MTETRSHNDVAMVVRQHDPDRYFAALFAPAEKRPALMALYAFNHELARIGESVREPMLGEIRLQWWRESLEAAQRGTPRSHETARALQSLHQAAPLPQETIDSMLDARAFDFSPDPFETVSDLEDYLDHTSGGLMRLAACVLGAKNASDNMAREAGLAYGLIGLLRAMPMHARRAKVFLPMDLVREAGIDPGAVYAPENRKRLGEVRRAVAARALAHFRSAQQLGKLGAELAAYLPAALAPLEIRLTMREANAPSTREIPLYRKQLALLGAAIRGRL